jgi:hypothetical protein
MAARAVCRNTNLSGYAAGVVSSSFGLTLISPTPPKRGRSGGEKIDSERR